MYSVSPSGEVKEHALTYSGKGNRPYYVTW
jgi:hypothetical protein